MNKKSKNKIMKKNVPLSKSLGDLMRDEDGFVSKENILKVGLSTFAALGVAGAVTNISGQVYQSTHTNTVSTSATNAQIAPNCAQHTNVSTHSSY